MSGASGWDDDGDGWDDCGGESGVGMSSSIVDVKVKSYEFIADEEMNGKVIHGLEELTDLFGMEIDELVIVARFFNWNQVRMNDWFDETR